MGMLIPRVLVPLLPVLFLAGPASGATISVEVTTTVGSVIIGGLAPLFSEGEAVRIRYSYDDFLPDEDPTPAQGEFTEAVLSLSVEFLDSGLFLVFGNAGSSILTNDNSGGFTDTFSVSSMTRLDSSSFAGELPTILSVVFGTTVVPGPPTLVVDERPAAPPFDFLSGNIAFGTALNNVFLTFDGGSSVAGVPEPRLTEIVASLLLASALASSRRRRARS